MLRLLSIPLVAALALALFGYVSARQDPVIVRHAVPIAGLAAPLRIVQLSDSHASSIDMPAERLARVVAMMNALHPDLIVLTGDYVSGNPDDWSADETRAALAPFARLHAPLGVYAVLGNHDGAAQTAAALRGTGVRLLKGSSAGAGPLTLVGADDLMQGSPAVEAMRRELRHVPEGRPAIVLVHEPDFFNWLERRPATMIAGHTHGGQIILPLLGTRSISPFLDAHLRGVFREKGHTLIVSSGLGTSVLPMRIGVPPEIVEVTLVPIEARAGVPS